MLAIGNLTSYVPPLPLAPIRPNFAFCHPAYGVNLNRQDGLYLSGILPLGTRSVQYHVSHDEDGGSARSCTLPFDISFAGIAIKVEIAGPVNIDEIELIPNGIRGMAGHLANHCLGRRGVGGFVTAKIQGLVDYISNPDTNLDAAEYPDDTAFVTLTMASSPRVHWFPGDNDPFMAEFLQNVAQNAMRMHGPLESMVFADRVIKYGEQAQHMSRLGTVSWWDNIPLGLAKGNHTEDSARSSNVKPDNDTVIHAATLRRRKRSK